MDLSRLESILEKEPKYRLKQAKEAVFKNLVLNWSEATHLPPKLREELNKECPLAIKGKIVQLAGDDTVLKAVIILGDGLKIESVLMKHANERFTVCVSSQVGCPMGCGFCATGVSGFKRNLTAEEITEQVLFFARHLRKHGGKKVTNIVYMGMGEPFLNYDNVLSSMRTLNDKDGLNIGARKISVSTLAQENLQVNLAISLHAPEAELRNKLVPADRKYPLKDILSAADDYIKKTSRRVMFEYILLKGVNDSPEHARKLAKLMQNPLYFVNLIAYNPVGRQTSGQKFLPSPSENINKFKEILKKAGVPVSQRYRFGHKIKAACGQLAARLIF